MRDKVKGAAILATLVVILGGMALTLVPGSPGDVLANDDPSYPTAQEATDTFVTYLNGQLVNAQTGAPEAQVAAAGCVNVTADFTGEAAEGTTNSFQCIALLQSIAGPTAGNEQCGLFNLSLAGTEPEIVAATPLQRSECGT